MKHSLLLSLCVAFGGASTSLAADLPPGVLAPEVIYETAPFPPRPASTIEKAAAGLVAAWFGGSKEKHPDGGIWVSRHDGKTWSAPVEVANGVQSADPPVVRGSPDPAP